MATKSSSKHKTETYKVYQNTNRQATNRKRKLERLLKKFPNNLQLVEALKNIKYRRKTPKTTQWSHTSKSTAELFKKFKTTGEQKDTYVRRMFSLCTRANGGSFSWNF